MANYEEEESKKKDKQVFKRIPRIGKEVRCGVIRRSAISPIGRERL